MRLPPPNSKGAGDRLASFAQELIDECCTSREQRRAQMKMWKSYYYTGTSEGQQARYNRCYAHVDRLASYLFSPADVRFSIEYDQTEDQSTLSMGQASARHLNREFHRCGIDMAVAGAVNDALYKGCVLEKLMWGHDGLEAWEVQPEMFGVLREDIAELDRQDAFVHTTFMTKSQFRRTLTDHPDKDEILKKVDATAQAGAGDTDWQEDFFHQVVIGGTQPVSTTTSAGSGMVGVMGVPVPMLAPEVASRLIRMDELWVIDDDRQDYTTIRMVKPDIMVEGRLRRRNLCGVRGEHPFRKVCPNEVSGYFWGMSEIAQIYKLQDLLNDQVKDMTRLTRMKADPARALIGFSGMTQEKYKILKRPGGFVSEESPNAKIESLAPDIPPELFQAVDKTLNYFDDVAGFMPIMQGQGEPGVRAGAHAQTLARNASPRMRDRALLVERQVVDIGDFCLKLMMDKKATVFSTDGGKDKFMLAQLPDGYRVSVDSHTSSPAFQEDYQKLAFALARAGAIDEASLIMLTHPPHEDTLILQARQRAEAKAEMVKKYPELAFGKGKGRK